MKVFYFKKLLQARTAHFSVMTTLLYSSDAFAAHSLKAASTPVHTVTFCSFSIIQLLYFLNSGPHDLLICFIIGLKKSEKMSG